MTGSPITYRKPVRLPAGAVSEGYLAVTMPIHGAREGDNKTHHVLHFGSVPLDGETDEAFRKRLRTGLADGLRQAIIDDDWEIKR